MTFFRHHILFLLCALLLTACATTTSTPGQPQETSPPQLPKDPLQTAEHWLKTGQSTQNQPIHTDFWTETQRWNSPRTTRLYLATPDEPNKPTAYIAIITDASESPEHALELTITHQQNTWQITHIQPFPARQLWPRF